MDKVIHVTPYGPAYRQGRKDERAVLLPILLDILSELKNLVMYDPVPMTQMVRFWDVLDIVDDAVERLEEVTDE